MTNTETSSSTSSGARAALLLVPAIKSSYYDNVPSLATNLRGVVFDLEDSVAAHAKGQARAILIKNLTRIRGNLPLTEKFHLFVRVNNRTSPYFQDDLQLIEDLARDGLFPSVMYPKYEDPTDLAALEPVLTEANRKIFVNIESFPAVQHLSQLVHSQLPISAAAVGAEDISALLGIERPQNFYSNPLLSHVSASVAVACHASQIEFWGNIWPYLPGPDTLHSWYAEIENDLMLGATGKIIFHPRQIADVNLRFASIERIIPDVLSRLEALVECAQSDGSTVMMWHEKMIDTPETVRAIRLATGELRKRAQILIDRLRSAK